MTIAAKSTAAAPEWILRYNSSTSRFEFFVSNSAGTTTATATAATLGAPSTATWYFIVARRDLTLGQITLSVNGVASVAADTTAWTGTITAGAAPFTLGALGTPANYWNGRIDEVLFCKSVWDSTRIAYAYNSGSGRALNV